MAERALEQASGMLRGVQDPSLDRLDPAYERREIGGGRPWNR